MHLAPSPCLVLAVALFATSLLGNPSSLPPAGSRAEQPVLHTVKRGETIWSICQKHQTSIGELMEYNQLSNDIVREGMILKIPKREAPAKIAATPSRAIKKTDVHLVKPGETFWSIAADHRISPQQLADANPKVHPNRLYPEMELILPSIKTNLDTAAKKTLPSPSPAKTETAQQHTVTEGETYFSIAKKRNISVNALIAANPDVKPERLFPGLKLNLPKTAPAAPAVATSTPATPASPAPKPSKVVAGKRHTVRQGDSIASIARQYDVEPEAILQENRLSPGDSVYIGDILNIPTSIPSQQEVHRDARPRPTPGNAHVNPDGSIPSYIVQEGENEDIIAATYGLTREQLYKYNQLSEATRLRPGDEIMIPPTPAQVVSTH